MEIFSKRLRTLRENSNMTQQEVASKLGISQSYYSKFEYNSREPNLETVLAIADIFDCSIDYLLGRDKYSLHQEDMNTVDVVIGLKDGEFIYGDETFPIPADILKGNEGIMFEIKDESMIGYGLLPGTSALISLGDTYYENSSLLVSHSSDSLLVREVTKQGDNYILSPANNAFKPEIINVSNLRILGRVVGLFQPLD